MFFTVNQNERILQVISIHEFIGDINEYIEYHTEVKSDKFVDSVL